MGEGGSHEKYSKKKMSRVQIPSASLCRRPTEEFSSGENPFYHSGQRAHVCVPHHTVGRARLSLGPGRCGGKTIGARAYVNAGVWVRGCVFMDEIQIITLRNSEIKSSRTHDCVRFNAHACVRTRYNQVLRTTRGAHD